MIFENDTTSRSIRNALRKISAPSKSLRDCLKELPGTKIILSSDKFWENMEKERKDRIHKPVPF